MAELRLVQLQQEVVPLNKCSLLLAIKINLNWYYYYVASAGGPLAQLGTGKGETGKREQEKLPASTPCYFFTLTGDETVFNLLTNL